MEGMEVSTFWQNKRVLITGHTGFKGSWLCLWLQSMGANVVGYSLAPPTTPSLFEVARVQEGMVSVIGEIRDLDRLCSTFKKYKPEIVIHMAAQSLVRSSYLDPVETYSINVMGSVNLLEAVRRVGSVRAVLNVTSDKCYENREWVWGYRENEAMGGYDPYSNSKGCAELVTSAYRNSYFNPCKYHEHGVAVASARAGNVIGGGDWALDRLIPDTVRAITNGIPVNIRNPKSIRPWQFVLEPLSGYLMLVEKLYNDGIAYAEAWNFGPDENDAKSVEWIVDKFVNTWGDGASWILDNKNHPHEANYLKLDCSKSKFLLGWSPKWSLEKTVWHICEWNKAYVSGKDMHKVCMQQIREYMTV